MEKPISPKRIDFTLLDSTAIEIKEDSHGFFFMVGDYRANIPPHYGARNFTSQEVLSFFMNNLNNLGIGIIACYLYDLLKKQRIKNVKIEGNSANTEEEIKKALENE
jgi:hypothetical protein